MSIEDAIATTLLADAPVAALVSTRVYSKVLPQGGTLPAITHQRIATPRVRSLSGPSGLASPHMQITCWASTSIGCRALADAVRVALDGYVGVVGTLSIADAFVDDEGDLYEPAVGRDTLKRHGSRMDFVFWHPE